MRGPERQSRVTAEFYLPGVMEDLKQNDWKYSGLRFLVTNTADPLIVRHVLDTVRR